MLLTGVAAAVDVAAVFVAIVFVIFCEFICPSENVNLSIGKVSFV